MSVIKFAEERLKDSSNNDHETIYWAAYLDGARAQKKENVSADHDYGHIVFCAVRCAVEHIPYLNHVVTSYAHENIKNLDTETLRGIKGFLDKSYEDGVFANESINEKMWDKLLHSINLELVNNRGIDI